MYNRNDIIYPENYENEDENKNTNTNTNINTNTNTNTKEITPSPNNSDSSKLPDPPTGPPPYENNELLEEIKNSFGSLSNGHLLAGSIDSGAITPCLYKYIYIFPNTGKVFWIYLTYVGKKSISGYQWTGNRWVYFGMSLVKIDSFICY